MKRAATIAILGSTTLFIVVANAVAQPDFMHLRHDRGDWEMLQACTNAPDANPEQRLADCSRVIAEGEGFAPAERAAALVDRGAVYLQLNQPAQAVPDFQQAIQLAPKLAASYTDLAYAYLVLGQFQQSIDADNQALAINHKEPFALYQRGLAKRKMGDGVEGNADIAEAKVINPKVADTYADYGEQQSAAATADAAVKP